MKARSLPSLFAILALVVSIIAACGPQPSATTLPPTQTPVPTTAPSPEPTLLPTQPPTPEPTATPEPTPTPRASFYPAPCPFDLPAGQVEAETVECGYLSVPEDRSDPKSPTIRLAVAIFHPSGRRRADPIIYLEGGPGGSPLKLIRLTFAQQFEPLLAAERDIVVFDPRGVGASKPALDCPHLRELGLDLLDNEIDGVELTWDQALERYMEATLQCGNDAADLANLEAYNTATSADDVEDLRLALGYEQVNLWGTSYGTWLALEVMRRYPKAIRSAVLDSVFPPDRDLVTEAPANADRAFDTLFEVCAADEACNQAFPNLRQVFFDTVERLNGEPARLAVTNPLTGKSYPAVINGDDLIGILFQLLYGTNVIPSLPQIIYDASAGSFSILAQLLGSLIAVGEAISSGQQLAVLCHDEIPFSSPDDLETALTQHPDVAPAFEEGMIGRQAFEICQGLRTGQAESVLDEPVSSDIPTLIMAGQFDPVTPPAWGQHAASTLKNSFFVEYPWVGHGASAVAGCPQEMMIAFLSNPNATPDEACTAEMGETGFIVPQPAVPVELVPFTNTLMGIKGLVPKGWSEGTLGVYSRESSAIDVTTVLEQAAPGTASQLLELVSGQLGLATSPEPVGERLANGLTWTLYAIDFQGFPIDLALTESDGLALIILLQTDPKEHDTLYQAVFLPAIDALVPIE